jgi:hypothetical protein
MQQIRAIDADPVHAMWMSIADSASIGVDTLYDGCLQ